MMFVDITKLQFHSGYPIDKVVRAPTQPVIVTNDGNTTTTGTNTGDEQAKIVTSSITNPYGKRAFVRFKWATNGTDFNGADAQQIFSYTITFTDIPTTSSPLRALKAACSIGISDNNITFITANGFHGNVSRKSTDGNTGYTPTSLDFTIYYAIFEIL